MLSDKFCSKFAVVARIKKIANEFIYLSMERKFNSMSTLDVKKDAGTRKLMHNRGIQAETGK